MSKQPLSDITVLDFSRFLPAPYCSMMLGDFGADVVRIEQASEVSKQERTFGRDSLSADEKQRLKSQEMLARNKRSVLLNLRTDDGRDAARRLVQSADVLLHDYRPGIMEKMDLGYAELKQLNPKLVYCAVSMCGQTGPYRDLPGHDPIALALSGALWRFGDGERPHIPGLPVADLSSGLQATIGILLALRARDTTGCGQFIDIAMSDCSLALMTSVMQRYLMDGREPDLGWRRTNVGVWQCADGQYICVTDLEPGYWQKFCAAVNRPDLLALEAAIPKAINTETANGDSAQQVQPSQYQHLQQELKQLFLSKTRDQWFALLKQAGTQVAPVNNLNEALRNEHALARNMIAECEDEAGNSVSQIGPAIKLSDTPGSIRSMGHLPGADTEQVLGEAGFSDTEIAKLKSAVGRV